MPLRADSGPGDSAVTTTSPSATRSTAKRGTPSPITICDRSVTSAEKLSKSTPTRSPLAGALRPAERDPVARGHHARVGVGGQPQLRALDVEEQAERAPGSLPGGAHVGGAAAQVVVRAVRAVQARAVEAGVDERVEHAGRVRRGPERGHDLGAA